MQFVSSNQIATSKIGVMAGVLLAVNHFERADAVKPVLETATLLAAYHNREKIYDLARVPDGLVGQHLVGKTDADPDAMEKYSDGKIQIGDIVHYAPGKRKTYWRKGVKKLRALFTKVTNEQEKEENVKDIGIVVGVTEPVFGGFRNWFLQGLGKQELQRKLTIQKLARSKPEKSENGELAYTYTAEQSFVFKSNDSELTVIDFYDPSNWNSINGDATGSNPKVIAMPKDFEPFHGEDATLEKNKERMGQLKQDAAWTEVAETAIGAKPTVGEEVIGEYLGEDAMGE